MKKILVISLLFLSGLAYAQIPVEALVGNKQIHYINYWQKNIDSLGKLTFFNLNRFAIDYNDKAYNNHSIEGQFAYQFKPWIGLSAGGSYEGNTFTPTVGLNLNYSNKKGDFFINTYPTFRFSEARSFNIFGLVGYMPMFTKDWGLLTQLIFSTTLGLEKNTVDTERSIVGLFTSHQQSLQLIRIGMNYKNLIQAGFGADLYQFYQNQGNFNNVGLFIRANF